MKQLRVIFSLFILLTVFSCTKQQTVTSRPVNPGDSLFQKAEKSFAEGEHDKALHLFSKYIEEFPEQPLAPAAHLKTGLIYATSGDFETARSTYKAIIRNYPKSPYVPDAMVEILVTYYNEGLYQEVIEKSYDIPEDLKPNDYLLRKYAVVGDAFLAIGSPMPAFDAFRTAYTQSSPPENQGVLLKIQKSAEQLSDEDLLTLADTTEQIEIKGYLDYQRCLNAFNSGSRYDALRLLNGFIDQYPTHRLTASAQGLKESLTSRDFDPLLVGCLLPTSGKYEEFGLKAQMGFDLAYNDFTLSEGNPVIRVVYRDTGSDPETTRKAVQEMADLGVAAIVGPIGTITEATEEAQVRGIPIIALTGKSGIAESGDYIFRNFLTPAMQIQSIVSYSFEVLGLNNFAILYPEETYGKNLMNLFWDEVLRYNGKVVGVESYKPGSTDFAESIRKLTGMHYQYAREPQEAPEEETETPQEEPPLPEMKPVVDFDAVFIPDNSAQVGLILPQLSFYDVGDTFLLGTNIWHSQELIDRAGKYAKNTIIPDAFFAGSELPAVQQFVSNFQDAFDYEPGFIEAVTYDSAMIIFNTLKEKTAETPTDIRDNLLTIRDYTGVTGVTEFDEHGNAWKDLYILQVSGKTFVERPE